MNDTTFSDDATFTINYVTKNKESHLMLNGRVIYSDYEENLIENYNFVGFAEQLMAVWLGYTEGVNNG